MSFVRINLALLFPPFAQAILALQTACAARGIHYYLTSGTRENDEQAKLYAQGRTTPGPIVTNSKPGTSFHNWGLAVDFTRDGDLTKAGLQPDWTAAHYDVLGEEAARLGLDWGGKFSSIVDRPHVQWRLPPGITLKTLQATGGMEAAWNLLALG